MVEVGAYATRSDAELAQAALAIAGIPSTLDVDDSGDTDAPDVTRPARLLVDRAYTDEATTVLARQPELQSTEEGNRETSDEEGRS